MATSTSFRSQQTATRPEPRSDGFVVVGSDRDLGLNLPQKMGKALWAPMLLMGLMGFAVAQILGIVRSNTIVTRPDDLVAVAQLAQVTTGVMFIGFLGVFAAITFAIARILGEFRSGGGSIQEFVTGHVQTLKMPLTARAMVASMMMGMMILMVAVVLHFVVAATVVGASDAAQLQTAQWSSALEGVRRIGVGMYLGGIVLGLVTIIHVLRFQSVRILELADEYEQRAKG